MTPRGASFIAKSPNSGSVRVWLDVPFPPDDGHLKWSNYPHLPEIVIGPKERIEPLDFSVLKGRKVELVVPDRGERYEALRDAVSAVEPETLTSLCLSGKEEVLRVHIALD